MNYNIGDTLSLKKGNDMVIQEIKIINNTLPFIKVKILCSIHPMFKVGHEMDFPKSYLEEYYENSLSKKIIGILNEI